MSKETAVESISKKEYETITDPLRFYNKWRSMEMDKFIAMSICGGKKKGRKGGKKK